MVPSALVSRGIIRMRIAGWRKTVSSLIRSLSSTCAGACSSLQPGGLGPQGAARQRRIHLVSRCPAGADARQGSGILTGLPEMESTNQPLSRAIADVALVQRIADRRPDAL